MPQQTALMKRDDYPADVRRLAQDIKDLLPNGNKLQDFEALALAQSARALRLNPFIGEIWYIPGHGLMSGIKGHRRTAHEQMHTTEGGGNYWPEFDVMTPEQKKQYLVPDTALGFICRLYDSATLRTYSETVERLFKAGAPWVDIKQILGDRPYTVGVGFYQVGESSRMKPHQCAMKRAEADALKRRFDLPFEGGAATPSDNDTDNGAFVVESGDESAAEIQAKIQAGKAASATLRGDAGNIDLGTSLVELERYTTGSAPAKQMTDRTTPEQPAPVQDENAKAARMKYQLFVSWCNDWVLDARAAKYAKEHGEGEMAQANMFHILGRVGKLGYPEVTAENVEAVKRDLQKHIEQTA